MSEFSYERFKERLFDDQFEAVSFYQDENNRLGSIELALKREGKTYLLSVESLPVHMQRAEIDMQDLDEQQAQDVQDYGAYVISADEILPADLLNLKKAPTDELKPFLVEQDPS